MKKFAYSLLPALFLFGCSESDDSGSVPELPKDPHKITVEQALDELEGILDEIDGSTRSGGRRVRSVETLAASQLGAETRSTETAEIGDLIHVVNFEDGAGYAILGADDRVPSVIAITEQGSLTASDLEKACKNGVETVGESPVVPDLPLYLNTLSSGVEVLPLTPIGYREVVYSPWADTEKARILTHVKWGQKEPYNYFVKKYIHNGIYTGCVAVALAQMVSSFLYDFY